MSYLPSSSIWWQSISGGNPKIYNISSKSILITGCDSGFGNKLAKRLDGLGCRVFAGCYTQKGADDLRSCSSHRVEIIVLDVTKTDSIKKALTFVLGRLQPDEGIAPLCTSGLWDLVNNAGVAGGASIPPEYLTKADLQEVLNVNILGMLDMTVHFLPLLSKARGRIVNTASVAGRVAAAPNILTYHVSKYDVEAMSDGLRPHMKKYGCHVAIIEPGLFATNIVDLDFTRNQIQKGYERMSSDDQEALGSDYVEKTLANVMKNMEKSANQNLDEVVDAYQHALFAVNPKKRYSCGWDARYIYVPLSYMPSWVQDVFLQLVYPNFFPIPDLTKFRK